MLPPSSHSSVPQVLCRSAKAALATLPVLSPPSPLFLLVYRYPLTASLLHRGPVGPNATRSVPSLDMRASSRHLSCKSDRDRIRKISPSRRAKLTALHALRSRLKTNGDYRYWSQAKWELSLSLLSLKPNGNYEAQGHNDHRTSPLRHINIATHHQHHLVSTSQHIIVIIAEYRQHRKRIHAHARVDEAFANPELPLPKSSKGLPHIQHVHRMSMAV